MLTNKSLFTFRYDVWPVGQFATNYTRWMNAKDPYEVSYRQMNCSFVYFGLMFTNLFRLNGSQILNPT